MADSGYMLKTPAKAYVSMIVFDFGLSCAKIAIGFQCLKVFKQPKILASCWTYVVVLSSFALVTCFLDIFLCLPWAPAWLISGEGAACLGQRALWSVQDCFLETMLSGLSLTQRNRTSTAVVNTITDVAAALLALPLFWEFDLRRRDKFALLFAFVLGLCTFFQAIECMSPRPRLTTCKCSGNCILLPAVAGYCNIIVNSKNTQRLFANHMDRVGIEHHHRLRMPADIERRMLATLLRLLISDYNF
jgi:hypothetical protein